MSGGAHGDSSKEIFNDLCFGSRGGKLVGSTSIRGMAELRLASSLEGLGRGARWELVIRRF